MTFSMQAAQPRTHTLIVNVQGFGDVVCGIPLLQAICKQAQSPVYVLLASPAHFELLRAEELPILPLYATSGLLRLIRELRGRIGIIVGMPEISRRKLTLLRAALGAKRLVTGQGGLFDWTQPFQNALDELAAAMGIPGLPPPKIRITPAESDWARQQIDPSRRPLIGVHCTSGIPSKSWPPERFGRVIAAVAEKHPDLAVISFGTRPELHEAEIARQFAGNTPWLEGAGQWNIRQSLAMLSQCDLFLSGDTGLMHMAAAVGTKTVALFGPTSATRRAPVYNGGVAMHPDTPCYPCFRGRWTPCDCLGRVTVDEVAGVTGTCLDIGPATHGDIPGGKKSSLIAH